MERFALKIVCGFGSFTKTGRTLCSVAKTTKYWTCIRAVRPLVGERRFCSADACFVVWTVLDNLITGFRIEDSSYARYGKTRNKTQALLLTRTVDSWPCQKQGHGESKHTRHGLEVIYLRC